VPEGEEKVGEKKTDHEREEGGGHVTGSAEGVPDMVVVEWRRERKGESEEGKCFEGYGSSSTTPFP
jgi:hypothetical protein